MSLKPGSHLGPYEILAPLGAGGMGEVYKARDPKLDRMVAIKVLPEHLARDGDALARFDREAKALAALQHPNVLGIFDFGTENDVAYAVMELLEGETLRNMVSSGPLHQRQALDIAVQIAHGLSAAHGKGIVHRDLKPENVIVMKDGRVKILDFGLAKRVIPVDLNTPTIALGTSQSTEKGMILGTMGYMSPEQVRGEAVDARSDIFSFGSVLFELFTGQRAFARDTAADTMAAILKEDPPNLESGNLLLPGPIQRILTHCLEKDPARRFQEAQDLGFALESAASGSGNSSDPLNSSHRLRGPRLRRLLMLAALASVAILAIWVGRRSMAIGPPVAPIRFEIRAPTGTRLQNSFAVSPDGSRIVYAARGSDGQKFLWLRSLANLTPLMLIGTEGASLPFWSPDSRFIAFFAVGKLKKLDASGGPPVTLCDVPGYPSGSWGSQRSILFAGMTDSAVSLIPESGGPPRIVLTADASRRETSVCWPSFLPDGRHFLYLGRSDSVNQIYVRVADVADGASAPLLENCSRVQYMPSGPGGAVRSGWLLFARNGSLLAQPFDCDRLKLSGETIAPGQEIWQHSFSGAARFSVSDNGLLASQGNAGLARLAWMDRTGMQTGTLAAPALFESLRLSSDPQKVVVSRGDPHTGLKDILVGDLSRNVFTRLELGPGDQWNPIWSPDGTRIAFSVGTAHHPPTMHMLVLRGAGTPEPLQVVGGDHTAEDWSPDGRFLIYFASRPESDSGLWVLDLDGKRKSRKFLSVSETIYSENSAQFSPDGHWIAYCASESGRHEIFLTTFPDPGVRIRVSATGGSRPRWKRDGSELYFVSTNNEMIATPIKLGPSPQIGAPRSLFHMNHSGWRDYDVTANGERFLVVENLPSEDTEAISLAVNWESLLHQ